MSYKLSFAFAFFFAASVFAEQAFVVGVMIPDGAETDMGVTMPGYPPAMAPIYESLPDRKIADALGLGAFGVTPDHLWLYPGFRTRPRKEDLRRNMPQLRRTMNSGLPLIADVTVRRDSYTWMTYMEGVNPKEEAWIKGETHGFPYTFATPEGLGLWQVIWRNCAKWFADESAAPAAWFLFRDADWWDESSAARREFSKWLSSRFATADEIRKEFNGKFATAAVASREKNLAQHPRLQAAFARFHEEKSNEALEIAEKIFAPKPDNPRFNPSVFFQPKTLHAKGIDLRAAAAYCAIIVAPADESGRVFTPLFLGAIANENQPLALVGMRVPPSREKLRDALLTQFARGYGQVWLADWRSDAKSRIRYTKDASGKSVRDNVATETASRAARPTVLNPYTTPPGTLDGIREARKIIEELAPLFTRENRARGAETAILYSRSSLRVAGTKDAPEPEIIYDTAAEILMNLHIKTTVVFEEDSAALTNGQFRALIATDSSFAASSATLSNLAAFAESGGHILMTEKALSRNEYGEQIKNHGLQPSNQIVKLKNEDFADELAETLAAAGVKPFCQCLDPATNEPLDGVEIWCAETESGEKSLMIFNRRNETVEAKIDGETMRLNPDECVVSKR